MAVMDPPFGIIISNGALPKRPAVIWAYLWAEDQRDQSEPWHRQTPGSRNG